MSENLPAAGVAAAGNPVMPPSAELPEASAVAPAGAAGTGSPPPASTDGRLVIGHTPEHAGALFREPEMLLGLDDDETDEPATAFYLLLGFIVAALLLTAVWLSDARREADDLTRPVPRASRNWPAPISRRPAVPAVTSRQPNLLPAPSARRFVPAEGETRAEGGTGGPAGASRAPSSLSPLPERPLSAVPNGQMGSVSSPGDTEPSSSTGGREMRSRLSPDLPLTSDQSGGRAPGLLGSPAPSPPVIQGYSTNPPPAGSPFRPAGPRISRPLPGASRDNSVPAH